MDVGQEIPCPFAGISIGYSNFLVILILIISSFNFLCINYQILSRRRICNYLKRNWERSYHRRWDPSSFKKKRVPNHYLPVVGHLLLQRRSVHWPGISFLAGSLEPLGRNCRRTLLTRATRWLMLTDGSPARKLLPSEPTTWKAKPHGGCSRLTVQR